MNVSAIEVLFEIEFLFNVNDFGEALPFAFRVFFISLQVQKQPPRGVSRKRCSENMPQIYWRTPMPKCDFNKVALQLY